MEHFVKINCLILIFLFVQLSCFTTNAQSLNFNFMENIINQKQSQKIEESRYLMEYDFIIVGSGPGGCVLANRLTENPNWNVLLIEAGKVETPIERVPVMCAYSQSTAYNWDYLIEKSKGSCLAMTNQQCGFPRGKALGGTSVINYMIYHRGNKRDFDKWAEAGNDGWSFNDVYPLYLKSERSSLEESPHHNRNGYLSVEYNRYRTVIADAFVKGHKTLGESEVDYNSGNQLGVSYLQANTLRGQRHSAYRSFLEPILHRKNLHIMLNTRGTKILINSNTKIAYGVEYIRKNKKYKVMARKEVIISSGTFNTPQLLMLSGIGPREDLERIKVPLIQDLPVGKLLYDHFQHLGPTVVLNTTGATLNTERMVTIGNMMKYLQGRGIMTLPGGVEALSFLKFRDDGEPDIPDLELILVSGGLQSDLGSGTRKGMKLNDELYYGTYKQLEDVHIDAFTVLIMPFHPRAVGSLTLKDSNPFHWPKIYFNPFEYEEDVDMMLNGIKYVIKLIQTPAFQSLGARLHDVPLPSCAHIHFGSDDYWRCAVRTISSSLNHQVSTCKMGPKTDPTAVVSAELKVHGIQKLRIVDCSIIPEAITAHTNAPSFMIGEKAADMIKKEWGAINY